MKLINLLKELVTNMEIICDNCGWRWKIKDGGDDLYICYKCEHDNNPEKLQEEKEKRDRCLRIADRKFDKPSAYKSGAVVRCRKGDIWKGLKEENISNQSAIQKIDQLPQGKLFNDAKNIEGVFKKSSHSWSKVIELFEKNKNKSKLEVIDTKDIHITQPNIQANKVKNMLDKVNNLPPINVIEFEDGEKVIYDAHHRLVANWALGNDKIKVNLVKINNLKEEEIKNLKVYHSTDSKFKDFSLDHAWDGFWFTNNINVLKNKEAGAAGNKYIMTRYITLTNPAGWDEYDKYSIGELIDEGYDGVILPEDNRIDYLVFDPKSISKNIKETNDPQSGKAAPYGSGYSKLKEIIQEIILEDESLHKWFKRSGAPGKEGGWVDCNAPIKKDGKITGYKACGRKEGEKRAKYPSCRPTAAKCKDKGKGKTWGKTK